MKPTVVSADALFEEFRATLRWEWVAGLGASERRFDELVVSAARSGADLVGYLNYIHPYRVQILGSREVAYLMASLPEDQERRISRIVTLEPPVLIVADAQVPPERLVADDAVDLYRISQTTIEGKCPDLLQNLLEVRGIGLLDIRAIFGETAVRRKMRLKLIVHLVRKETMEREYERLPYEPLTQDVLGVPVLKVVIQVVAGRNIAVLVEAAVRNTVLQLRGIDTYQEFVERHRRAMDQNNG